jgi:cytochrome b6-f complex iron-sulfur subunit
MSRTLEIEGGVPEGGEGACGLQGPGEPATRRQFLQKGLSVLGWGALCVGTAGGLYETVRFFSPTVVFHPPSIYRIGKIEDFLSVTAAPDPFGVIYVESRWKNDYRFFVVREAKRVYALYARCTHLGCTVNWFPGLGIFKCPCHGSEFHSNGKEFAGPAPRPLDRLKIGFDPEGFIVVDVRTVYTEREFEEKKAYIEIG